MTISLETAKTQIHAAQSLDELKSVLNDLMTGMHEQDYANLNITNLPTFGGATPTDTSEIFSWNADMLLVQNGSGWSLTPRVDSE